MALTDTQQNDILTNVNSTNSYRIASDEREGELVRLLLQRSELLIGVLVRLRETLPPSPVVDDLIYSVETHINETRRREVLRRAQERQNP